MCRSEPTSTNICAGRLPARERGLPTTNDPISSFGSEKQNGPPCTNKKKRANAFFVCFLFYLNWGRKSKEQQQQELQATSDIMYATVMSTPDPIESSSLGR
jgi:hypothetical protein